MEILMADRVLNRHWVREVDRRAIEDYGMSGLVLMENAARGAVDVLMQLGCRGPVAIACGKGNNAGDGFAMARHLDVRGIAVRVLVWSEPQDLRGDAAANFAILQKCEIPIVIYGNRFDAADLQRQLAGCEWIVDALLGTGSTGDPRPPLNQVIEELNRHPAQKLAVDISSGLDCDTGQASATTFRADHTVTFVAAKPGLLTAAAQSYVGQLHVVDIGAPRALVEEVLRLASAG
jgi:NAD(P)H-hydrate epimerase